MNLLRVLDLDPSRFDAILDLAALIKAEPKSWNDRLRHRTMVGIFDTPSTRTRVAFATAAHRLGLLPIILGRAELQLSGGEELADTARSLSAYATVIVVRMSSHAALEEFAAAATVPVVNALSDEHHPCEAIASIFTLREHFGRAYGLRLAYVGDGNNIAHSLLEAGALAGAAVAVASPAGRAPHREIVARANDAGASTGGAVCVVEDPAEAVARADAVFTDVWPTHDENF
jgi:ornithine carbamoyltransferase